MTSARAAASWLWTALLVTACLSPRRLGQEAAEGALEALEPDASESTGRAPEATVDPSVRDLVHVAVEEALRASLEPGTGGGGAAGRAHDTSGVPSAAPDALVGAVAASIADGITRELTASLGPEGQGPLGESLSRLAQRTSEQVVDTTLEEVRSELHQMLPECGPADDPRRCLRQRVQSLSRAAGAGAVAGALAQLSPWGYLLAAAGGALIGALAVALFRPRGRGNARA